MATTEGNTVRGGKVAQSISKYLNENFDNNYSSSSKENWKNFREIRLLAKQLVKDAGQALVVTEHDDDVDNLVFLPKQKNKDGTYFLFFFILFCSYINNYFFIIYI